MAHSVAQPLYDSFRLMQLGSWGPKGANKTRLSISRLSAPADRTACAAITGGAINPMGMPRRLQASFTSISAESNRERPWNAHVYLDISSWF